MSGLSRLIAATALIVLNISNLPAQADESPASTLDELLARVIANGNADSETSRKRLERFTRERDQQEALLQEARRETARLEQTAERLNEEIAGLDRETAMLETQLSERLGNFGELFGVTRQVAGDTRSQIAGSLISAQFPARHAALQEIASSKDMPTLEQLRTLWITLLQEQTEQGKVSRFNAIVSDETGHGRDRDVIRIGPFAVIADGEYLVYKPETGQLAGLARQPAARYTQSAERLSGADPGEQVAVAIDPSRGTILGLLVQSPNLLERFHQGGLPGYVVSVLALIGLSIGFWRLLNLWRTGARVQRQMRNNTVDLNNPLGRVLWTYEEHPGLDVEALELKLDDAVLKEVSVLDRGLGTLKVLAAVSPLIGLLGTVVGMILTFQAITLWGTGEPKVMAGGISQALVTTVQGLVAAIPLLLLHSLAHGRARLIQQVLEEQSAGLIARRAEKSHV
ncbi:MAG TPA: MotA/TolQ/ExbB proton channel family protein [Gammaproteobacteria bacterium]